MRVLVVDDDAVFSRYLVEVLEAEGHQAEAVSDGLSAFERCLGGAYDVVISDVRMPLMLGTELATELRRDRPDQPVILISAFADEQLAARAAESGSRLLSKPFDATVLARMLDDVASQRSVRNSRGQSAPRAQGVQGVIDVP
jgi:CheY-like chemotaxis protein